jgi:hypothetical protein
MSTVNERGEFSSILTRVVLRNRLLVASLQRTNLLIADGNCRLSSIVPETLTLKCLALGLHFSPSLLHALRARLLHLSVSSFTCSQSGWLCESENLIRFIKARDQGASHHVGKFSFLNRKTRRKKIASIISYCFFCFDSSNAWSFFFPCCLRQANRLFCFQSFLQV